MGDIRDANGNTVSSELYYKFNNPLLPRDSSDTSIPYRDWYYWVAVTPESAGRLFDERRKLDEGMVSFQPGAPGELDVPRGTRFPAAADGNVPGEWHEPATPGSTAPGPLVLNPDGIDPATGHERRAELDWLPLDSRITPLTGAGVVKFRRGYPDFMGWIVPQLQFTISLQHGDEEETLLQHGDQDHSGYDFQEADDQLALWLRDNRPGDPSGPFVTSTGRPYRIRAKRWMDRFTIPDPNDPTKEIPCPLTWHHHQDMRTMQLVPGLRLNNTIAHDGGGAWARDARW